jgi:hypothetical protein
MWRDALVFGDVLPSSARCIHDQGGWLRPHHRQKRSNTHNVHDPREIVGEYVRGHLGASFRQALHSKVGRSHAHLEGGKWMLRRSNSLRCCTCSGLQLALTDEPASVERTAAIRPAADINRLPGAVASVENDPEPT